MILSKSIEQLKEAIRDFTKILIQETGIESYLSRILDKIVKNN